MFVAAKRYALINEYALTCDMCIIMREYGALSIGRHFKPTQSLIKRYYYIPLEIRIELSKCSLFDKDKNKKNNSQFLVLSNVMKLSEYCLQIILIYACKYIYNAQFLEYASNLSLPYSHVMHTCRRAMCMLQLIGRQ